MKKYVFTGLMAFMVASLIVPDMALAISAIDQDVQDFTSWFMDNIVGNIIILAIALWAINAKIGIWQKATDWKAGAGLAVLAIIAFAAEDIVNFFR